MQSRCTDDVEHRTHTRVQRTPYRPAGPRLRGFSYRAREVLTCGSLLEAARGGQGRSAPAVKTSYARYNRERLIPLGPPCYPVLERDRRDGAMTDFPRSLPEFERRFPDEAACAEWLLERRWGSGF